MFCCICVGESRKEGDGEAEKVKALPTLGTDDGKEDPFHDAKDGLASQRLVRRTRVVVPEEEASASEHFFSTSPSEFCKSIGLRSARLGEGSEFHSISPSDFRSERPAGQQSMMLKQFVGPRPDLEAVSKSFVNVGARRPSIENVTKDQYVEKHEEVFDRLLEGEHDPRWTPKKAMDGLEVFQFFEDSQQMTAVKAVISMNLGERGGLEFLVEKILDVASRPEYDETCMYGRTIEQHLPQYSVMYVQIETPTPLVTNRDLLLLGRLCFEQDGTLLIALSSSQHDEAPNKAEFVRATMATGGYIIRPTEDPDVFKVTYLVQVDAGGLLPAFVQKVLAWKQGLTLLRFKQKFNL